jgi:hypothetical protein
MSILDKNEIWLKSNQLAEEIYAILDQFSESEKFNTQRKLQNAANDLIFYVGQAIGSESQPHNAEFDWIYANKNLLGLRTIYRFAAKQHMIKLKPELMVLMDKIEVLIAKELNKSTIAAKQVKDDDIKDWLKKYDLWKKMNKESHHEN